MKFGVRLATNEFESNRSKLEIFVRLFEIKFDQLKGLLNKKSVLIKRKNVFCGTEHSQFLTRLMSKSETNR